MDGERFVPGRCWQDAWGKWWVTTRPPLHAIHCGCIWSEGVPGIQDRQPTQDVCVWQCGDCDSREEAEAEMDAIRDYNKRFDEAMWEMSLERNERRDY